MKVLESTPCATATLAYFGVKGVTWNNRTQKNVWADTLRRAGYAVRSRMSKLGKRPTVGSIRKKAAEIAAQEPQIKAFIVKVERHVLVMDRQGNTVVDTAPRKRDARRVYKFVAVW